MGDDYTLKYMASPFICCRVEFVLAQLEADLGHAEGVGPENVAEFGERLLVRVLAFGEKPLLFLRYPEAVEGEAESTGNHAPQRSGGGFQTAVVQ